MKKLLAIACASSVLALASGANAGTTYGLTVQGAINPFCDITTTAGASDYTFPTGTGTGKFDNGTGGTNSGVGVTRALNVSANSQCAVAVSSAHGGLQGATNTSTLIPYAAGTAFGTVSGTHTVVNGVNTALAISAATMVLGNNTLNVKIELAANAGPYPVDTYSDTLTITVTAS